MIKGVLCIDDAICRLLTLFDTFELFSLPVNFVKYFYRFYYWYWFRVKI